MTYVVTLVSSPNDQRLDDKILEQVARCLPAVRSLQWLDEKIAADIMFTPEAEDTSSICKILHEELAGLAIDFFVQPVAGRRKKVLVADMDSTMIGQECIDELADFANQKAQVAAITERAMRGEIAFEAALRERVAILRGINADVVETIIAERITLAPGARALVQTMRAKGAFTALVSGGFTVFAQRIAEAIGFHAYKANVLLMEDDKFSGSVAEPILGKTAKREALEHFCVLQAIPVKQALAVGDGANDLAMLELAGLGVAFHAKPSVAAAARARIDHTDLTALLYAQGYKRSEFKM